MPVVRVALLSILGCVAFALSGCAARTGPAPVNASSDSALPALHRVEGESYTIVASVLPPRGVQPEFSFQGFLTDAAGEPVPGPISVRIGIAENTNDLPFEAADFPDFTTDDGRFDVRLPVPSPDLMLDTPNLFIAVLDAQTQQDLVPRIPLLTVPRAGSAELARHARTADTLTNQVLIDIPLAPEWTADVGDFDPPRAMRVGRLVALSGFARDVDQQASPVVATLPFGFRPAKRLAVPALVTGPGMPQGEATARVEIFPTGEVVIFYQPPFTPTGLHFSGVSFVAAP